MVSRAANLPEPPPDYLPVFGDFSPDHYSWARKAAYAGLLEGLQGMGVGYNCHCLLRRILEPVPHYRAYIDSRH